MSHPVMHDDIEKVLFTNEEIVDCVADLGKQITADYRDMIKADEEIVLVCVLRGAAIFMSDIARYIDLPLEMDYMAMSSYGSGTTSSGMVRIQKDLSSSIEGKHVILVEDIIDTGLTLNFTIKNLLSRNPLSVEVVALLHKNTAVQQDVDCKYIGFECPDEFIVGYGLDYAEKYRNLNYIGTLRPEVYQDK